MANENPQIVLDAATHTQPKLPIPLHDLTVSRYAWLEKLDSPFIQKDKEFTVSNVVPTIWVLASSKDELRQAATKDLGNVKLDALDWADEKIGVDQLPAMIEAVAAKLLVLSKAAPSSGDSEKN